MLLALAVALVAQVAPPSPSTTSPSSSSPPAAEPARILVLDFRDDGAGAELVRIVRDTLVVHLSQRAGREVLSTDDVRRVGDLEAAQQALGCSDQSCLAELAGAVDADLVFFGNVGRLGSLTQINISALDARKGTVKARESIEVADLEAVPARVRTAADRLIGVAVPEASSSLSPWTVAGGVAVGAGVLGAVVGGVLQGTALARAAGKELGSADVVAAQETQAIALPVFVVGAVVAGAGVVALVVAE